MDKKTDSKRGNLYILMTAILWSTGGILIKFVSGNAIAINGARSLVAFLFFCIYRRQIRIRRNKVIWAAAICLMLTNTLFVFANQLTTAANAIVLQYMAPFFVLLYDCIYRKKLPKKQQVGIILAAFLGMVLFFFDQLDGGKLAGNFLAVFAGVCFAGVFFFNSLPDSSGEDASMLGCLLSAVIAIPLYGDFLPIDNKSLAAVLLLGIFQVGLAYVLFSKGSKLTTAVNASIISLLEALLNPLWVFLFSGEKISRYALMGGCIILLSVVCNILLQNKTKA